MSNLSFDLAEGEGFEPSVSVSQYTGLANLVVVLPVSPDFAGNTRKTAVYDVRGRRLKARPTPVHNGSKVAHAHPGDNSHIIYAEGRTP